MDNTSISKYCETRLRNLMIKDKGDTTSRINNVLRAEIMYVLKNYFELQDYDMDIDILINSRGYYEVLIKAECRNIKRVSYIE